MAARKHRPVFMVRNDESGFFYLDIGVEEVARPDAYTVILKEVLTEKRFAKGRFSMLRDLHNQEYF